MPFALPEYDQAFGLFVGRLLRELARAHDPVLASIRFEPMASTLVSQIRTREGLDVRLPDTGVESEFTMDVEAVRRTDVAAFAEQMEQASEGYAKQLVGYVFETMNAVTQATGNVVDAGGAFSFEHLYEMLEKIELSIDENDELVMPSLVMHPDDVKKLPVITQEQQDRLDQLKARKLEEALARRRRRRLS